jgi:ATP-dependent exoDNAse (exonuclease V) alpha subunit
MLDESSLASTKQMRAFLEKIRPEDRVLVIGDTRQHQGVDAGRPFQQMQEAGMQTSRLDTIMRQKDPELLRAVQHLATNETEKGIALLAEQGRVTELRSGTDRISAIAKDYAANPENTIIVSPDNRSRQQINEAVRGELLKTGSLADDGLRFLTLSHRSDMTGPDRTWAAMYRPGDVVQYERGSRTEGIERGSFGVVRSSDAATNRVTVELSSGSSVEYDPKRVYGVNVYRESSREFATGDRLQFSALNKGLGISNRDMGTITKMEPDRLTVLMDGKEQRSVSFNPSEFRQFDHGYAVTSHSSQGLTADRVIANIDTDSSRSLINNRLAYVAISRASEDARIYTNNAESLGQRLATDVTKTAALDFTTKPEQPELSKQGAVAFHEYNNQDSRLAAVASDYARRPERAVIVAPDRAERDELTQLIRADLYAQGKLGRDAHAVSVLVEKDAGSKMRVESYAPGDKILYKTGSPNIDGIPHDSQATVTAAQSRGNVLSVRFDATREDVSYNPAQLRTQTRESRVFQEETR